MAFRGGFFVLASFPCLFYYDEALRRNQNDEAMTSDKSTEFRQTSSDLLELRNARTDAKLMRSHDASLFLKGPKKIEGCRVKVGDTTCEFEGQFLVDCCKQHQAEVCSDFRNYSVTSMPPHCDEFQGGTMGGFCSPEEEASMKKTTCLNDAGKSEKKKAMQKLRPEPTPVCRLKELGGNCDKEWLSPECCDMYKVFTCQKRRREKSDEQLSNCYKFTGRGIHRSACADQANKLAVETNYAVGNCQR
eukprot:TRINITY_DN1945_c1_g3_i1.p1 TRINITY_DN1945_c1_g3~~TRINITY_DN1945_c1_g3_i1.p1  ORF type:complete len:246 (-),score=41.67 TRINITY_DN1945_c1_g3_i1:156-893(-)